MAGKDTLALRGHHLGCVLSAFGEESDHPTVPRAVAWLRANPQGSVRVVVGPDDICLPCPKWDGETCLSGFEEMNVGKDGRFLDLLGMKDGDALAARELFARLMARADAAFFRSVCPNCSPDSCAEAARGEAPF